MTQPDTTEYHMIYDLDQGRLPERYGTFQEAVDAAIRLFAAGKIDDYEIRSIAGETVS